MQAPCLPPPPSWPELPRNAFWIKHLTFDSKILSESWPKKSKFGYDEIPRLLGISVRNNCPHVGQDGRIQNPVVFQTWLPKEVNCILHSRLTSLCHVMHFYSNLAPEKPKQTFICFPVSAVISVLCDGPHHRCGKREVGWANSVCTQLVLCNALGLSVLVCRSATCCHPSIGADFHFLKKCFPFDS